MPRIVPLQYAMVAPPARLPRKITRGSRRSRSLIVPYGRIDRQVSVTAAEIEGARRKSSS
jgi:hypothetical protein